MSFLSGTLSRFENGAKVDGAALLEAGLVRAGDDVKVLGAGRLKRKLNVEAHAFSNSARQAIEKAGGSVKVLGEPKPQKTEKAETPESTESASPQDQ